MCVYIYIYIVYIYIYIYSLVTDTKPWLRSFATGPEA